MILSAVHPAVIGFCAERCIELLRPAEPYARGRYTAEQLLGMAQSMPDTTLWVAYESADDIVAAFVTKIIEYPNMLSLYFLAAGSVPHSMKTWFPLAKKTFTEYARKCKCSRIEALGRPGWTRFLRKYQVKADMTLLELDIGRRRL